MTLERMQLSVAGGEGLVARFGDVAVVVAAEAADHALVDQLLSACRALGSDAAAPGNGLLDGLSFLLGRGNGAGVSFCVLLAADDAFEVVLQGELDLVVARNEALSRHTGPEPGTWVDVVIDGEFDSLTVGPRGARPVADPRIDLQAGVIGGSGLLLHRRESPVETAGLPAPAAAAAPVLPTPPPPEFAMSDEQQPAGVAGSGSSPPRPFHVVSLAARSTGGRPPLPTLPVDPPGEGAVTSQVPVVQVGEGRRCPTGHLNQVGARYCATCGVPLDVDQPNGQGPRRPAGVLILDDGATYALDTGYVVGREPDDSGAVQSGRARPLVVQDPDRVVSRVHAEIRVEGGAVEVVDRDSANGTWVCPPGGTAWDRLEPNQPHRLAPGTHVLVGRRSFLFHVEPTSQNGSART